MYAATSGTSPVWLPCDEETLSLASGEPYASEYKGTLLLLRSSSGFTSRRSRMALEQGVIERLGGVLDIRSLGKVAPPGMATEWPKWILEGDEGMERGVGGDMEPWTECMGL